MIQFHLYTPAGTPSEPFFAKPIDTGTIIWLNAANGFAEKFFSDKETSELLYFAVVPSDFPRTPDEVEKLTFIEAQIVEPAAESAKVRISWVQTLGEWARAATFHRGDELAAAPEAMRPAAAVEAARDALRAQEATLSVSDQPARGTPAPWAHYFFKGASDKRGLLFAAPGAPSYLVKL